MVERDFYVKAYIFNFVKSAWKWYNVQDLMRIKSLQIELITSSWKLIFTVRLINRKALNLNEG
jgi:hypothetical protein